MLESLLKKINQVAGYVALGVMFGLLGLLSNIEIKDLDLWLHVGMGKFIAATKTVPAVDVISCTVAGTPWINHEWLFQLVVYWVHNLGGMDALITMQTGIVFATFALFLFLIYRKEKPWLVVVPLYWLLYVYQDRFTVRPDLFSLLFLVMYLHILFRFISARWALAAVFVIQLLWTNIHGFFIWGPLLIVLVWGGERVKRQWKLPLGMSQTGRLKDKDYQRLRFLLGVSVLACLVNPYGLKGLFYPLHVFVNFFGESRIFFDKILELSRPLSWDTLFSFNSYPYYKILIFASLFSFILNYRRPNISLAILWAVFFFFSATAIRNMVYFGFIAVLVIVENCAHLSWKDIYLRAVFPVWLKLALAAAVQFVVASQMLDYGQRVSCNGYFDFDTYERKSEFGGVSQRNFPHKAVDFLIENNIQGNFFNDFNSGAYLVGRCFPDIKVFIDGRTEVYGSQFFELHDLAWRGDEKTLEELMGKYQLTGAFLGTVYAPAPIRLVSYLFQNDDWALVYFDYDALVFLRKVPANRELIAKFRIDQARLEVFKNDLSRIRLRPVEPFRNINRAYSFFSMGLYDRSLAESHEALRVMPNNMEAHKIIGQIFFRKGDHQKAFEYLRAAKLLAPDDLEVRYHLALNFEAQKDFVQAADQAKFVLKSDPDNAYALVLLAQVYAKTKEYSVLNAMVPALGGVGRLHLNDLTGIGDILLEDKQYLLARRIFEKSLAISPDDVKVKEKLDTAVKNLNAI